MFFELVVKLMKMRFVFLLFVFFSLNGVAQDAFELQNNKIDYIKRARELRFTDLDSSMYLFEKAHKTLLKEGDTVEAINALLEMPDMYGQQVNYGKSYNGIWHALVLAENIENDHLRASIYNRLGRLYSFFKRKDKAFRYLNTSLKINKDLIKKGLLAKSALIENYYLLTATYREIGQPKISEVYLDSCSQVLRQVTGSRLKSYIEMERAHILTYKGKTSQALDLFKEIEPWFKKNRPSYLVLVYTYWGDVYSKIQDLEQSEKYYNKAIETAQEYSSHLDFSALTHERLADLYLKKGDKDKVIFNLQKAKDLDAHFFDSRSENNKLFLEIKDKYILSKERQEKFIQKQRVEKLEQQDQILLLQRIILLGAILFLLIIGLVYFRIIRIKHKAEKKIIARNKELELIKSKELIELKNKELASSALELVEKNELLGNLKNKLSSKNFNNAKDKSEVKKMLNSIALSNNQSWEEFKLRFTAVNEKFYEKLVIDYPMLTQGDQKICALIKLNFTSKDMARLLGISVESVHTTRYRLRKKMKLDRKTNLEDFIATL